MTQLDDDIDHEADLRRQFAAAQRDQLHRALLADREQVEVLACDSSDAITRRLAAHFLALVIIGEAGR